ncbi:cupin 2 conserved barrel domain-containing protein [Fusarium pseudocircinatum]|uniref:Cupin 2 conserved barrel domain-containing protein n=1 Tax=Fusarium pseudocircinatum TaxID=56676 RepID=A0A8H5LF33_9HYPO|nr:cupin 2 conserved barrel domain-containing protein [Fusarium pseudocircinatum]
MSSERRWDQRRFRLEESTSLNDGKRTIFIETITPGTTVPPHFHTRFSETFDLIQGSISVYKATDPDLEALEASARPLEVGKPQTVTPNLFHKYIVNGDEGAVLRVILEPGDADFERLLKIMNGLDADGKLVKMGDSLVLMAVVMELSDAHLIGPAKGMLDGVRREQKDEIEKLKAELLEAYDTEEALQGLLQGR